MTLEVAAHLTLDVSQGIYRLPARWAGWGYPVNYGYTGKHTLHFPLATSWKSLGLARHFTFSRRVKATVLTTRSWHLDHHNVSEILATIPRGPCCHGSLHSQLAIALTEQLQLVPFMGVPCLVSSRIGDPQIILLPSTTCQVFSVPDGEWSTKHPG